MVRSVPGTAPRLLRAGLFFCFPLACGPESRPGAAVSTPAPARASATASPPSSDAPPPPTVPALAKKSAPTRPPGPAFPPPDVALTSERSASASDGRWVPLTQKDGSATTLYQTTVHPHPNSPYVSVTLVAIDLRRLEIGFRPGKGDVPSGPLPFAPGLVPREARDRLVAVFNGGFQPRHGHWGMKLGDTTVVPPRPDGCTIALYGDGAVRIRSHAILTPTLAEMVALRQTPPCLLEQGSLHPDLVRGRDKRWGGHTEGLVTRRRSALGIDPSGEVLFYAVGMEATPKRLAEALASAGAADAAELNVNWNWTRFLLFEHSPSGAVEATTSLVEVEYGKSEYATLPSERDFFYLLRRDASTGP